MLAIVQLREEVTQMKWLRQGLLALALTGALVGGGAAIAAAQTDNSSGSSSSGSSSTTTPAAGSTAPAQGQNGNCPNM
jgi:hypothetical protein